MATKSCAAGTGGGSRILVAQGSSGTPDPAEHGTERRPPGTWCLFSEQVLLDYKSGQLTERGCPGPTVICAAARPGVQAGGHQRSAEHRPVRCGDLRERCGAGAGAGAGPEAPHQPRPCFSGCRSASCHHGCVPCCVAMARGPGLMDDAKNLCCAMVSSYLCFARQVVGW